MKDLLLTFTVLSNDSNQPEALATIRMLEGARKSPEPAGSAEPARRDRYTMRLPGEQWAISVAIPGYKVEREQTREGRTGIMMGGTHEGQKMNLSIFLEREKGPRTSDQCRKKYFQPALSTSPEMSEIRRWETDALALGQYLINIKEMVAFDQMHMHAYLGKDDACLDLHLSKVGFEEADRALFDEVFSSVRIERVAD